MQSRQVWHPAFPAWHRGHGRVAQPTGKTWARPVWVAQTGRSRPANLAVSQPCLARLFQEPPTQSLSAFYSAKTDPATAIGLSCFERAFRWFLLVELIRAILAILQPSLTSKVHVHACSRNPQEAHSGVLLDCDLVSQWLAPSPCFWCHPVVFERLSVGFETIAKHVGVCFTSNIFQYLQSEMTPFT